MMMHGILKLLPHYFIFYSCHFFSQSVYKLSNNQYNTNIALQSDTIIFWGNADFFKQNK